MDLFNRSRYFFNTEKVGIAINIKNAAILLFLMVVNQLNFTSID